MISPPSHTPKHETPHLNRLPDPHTPPQRRVHRKIGSEHLDTGSVDEHAYGYSKHETLCETHIGCPVCVCMRVVDTEGEGGGKWAYHVSSRFEDEHAESDPAGVVITNRQASAGLSTAMNLDRCFSCREMYASSGCKGSDAAGCKAASCVQVAEDEEEGTQTPPCIVCVRREVSRAVTSVCRVRRTPLS